MDVLLCKLLLVWKRLLESVREERQEPLLVSLHADSLREVIVVLLIFYRVVDPLCDLELLREVECKDTGASVNLQQDWVAA